MSGNDTMVTDLLTIHRQTGGGIVVCSADSDAPLLQMQQARTNGGFPVTMVSIGSDDTEGDTGTTFIVRGPGWRRVIEGYLWDTADIPGPDGTTVPCLTWLEEGDRLHVRWTGWRYASLDVPNGTDIHSLHILPDIGQVAVVGRLPTTDSLTLWLCDIGNMKLLVGEKIHQQDADALQKATATMSEDGLLTLTLAEQTLEVQMRPWAPRHRS